MIEYLDESNDKDEEGLIQNAIEPQLMSHQESPPQKIKLSFEHYAPHLQESYKNIIKH